MPSEAIIWHPGMFYGVSLQWAFKRMMARISRDRWIHPLEVGKIGLKVARYLGSGNPHATFKYGYHDSCEFVGMFRGQPLLCDYEKGYRRLLATVMRMKRSEKTPELTILKSLCWRERE